MLELFWIEKPKQHFNVYCCTEFLFKMINILNFLHFSSLLTKTSQAMDNPTFDNL